MAKKKKQHSGRAQYSFPGDADVMKALTRYSEKQGISLSAVIRQACKEKADSINHR